MKLVWIKDGLSMVMTKKMTSPHRSRTYTDDALWDCGITGVTEPMIALHLVERMFSQHLFYNGKLSESKEIGRFNFTKKKNRET